jgi:hypothetical protein
VTREHELLCQGKYAPAAIQAFIGHDPETYAAWYKTVTDEDFVPRDGRVAKLAPNDSREGRMKRPKDKTQELKNLVPSANPPNETRSWCQGVIPLGLEPRTT